MKTKEGPRGDSGANNEQEAQVESSRFGDNGMTVMEDFFYRVGWHAGYRARELEEEDHWRAMQAAWPRLSLGDPGHLTFAQLDQLRYGPGGHRSPEAP